MTVYQMIADFCNEVAVTWRKTQRINLALAMQAVLVRRSLTLSHLAQHLPVAAARKVVAPQHNLWHRLKRLRRFLGNAQVDQAGVMQRLLQLGLVVADEPGLRLPLLMDLTYLASYAFFVVSVPKGGRALPVAWQAFRRDLAGEPWLSRNQMMMAQLRQLFAWLAPTIETVVIADREFAASWLLRFLQQEGRDFVIRIDQETWLQHPAYTGALKQLALRPGDPPRWFDQAIYSQTEPVPLNLLAVWKPGYDEPWFLATSLSDPDAVFALYRQRMKIEHGFRDWKTHLRLKGTLQAQNVAYVKGLMTVLALLYWFISLCGLRWTDRRFWSQVACWGQPSFFKTALDLLTSQLDLVAPTWPPLLAWLRDKLWPLLPLPPTYRLRYRRFRSPLSQTG